MFVTSKMLQKAIPGRLKKSDYLSSTDTGSALAESEDDYRITRQFMTDAYKANSWIRAIVDLTSERFSQVDIFPLPLNAKKDEKTGGYSDTVKRNMEKVMNLLIQPNEDAESFDTFKRKIAHDLLVYDEAGIQIIKGTNVSSKKIAPYELRANVTGEELYVNANPDGTLKSGTSKHEKAFLQVRNNEILSGWNKSEFVNFIRNRMPGYANGFSPIESIAASILGDMEAHNYNLRFFENNAKPNIAFLFNNLGFGQGKGTLERAKKWYNSEHKGKPHLPLFMGSQKGEVKIQELTMSNKDMEFTDWGLFLLSRIMSVYGMQPMVLGILTDTTGKLNSEVQGEQYKKNAIIPLTKVFVNTMNPVLIWGDQNFNFDDIYLSSSNLDIDDDKKQADIWEIFLRSGVITINQVRNELQMAPVDWGDEPFVPLNYSPLSILRDYQLSRIEANMKNAMNSGIDNNVDGEGDKPKDDKPKPKPKGGKAVSESELHRVNSINYKVPTGLEHIEPSVITDVVTKMMKDRDRKTTFSFADSTRFNSINNVAQSMGLEWKNIVKKRSTIA